MRSFYISFSSLMTAVVALTGCGGGATALGPGGGGNPTYDVVEFLDSTSDATSVIGGHRLNSDSGTILRLSATLDHQTRNLNDFTDGVITFSDATGDDNGTWTDGTTTATPGTGLTGSYAYVGLYNITSPNGSGPAIVGVSTPSGALPASGSAKFVGSGFIDGATLGGGQFSTSASSAIMVNFGTNTASVNLMGLTGTTEFDTLQINGLSLNPADNTLSGGDVLLISGSDNVTADVLGNERTDATGVTLFGLKSGTVAPAEVGGVFLSEGSDGTIFGGFIGK